MESDLGAPSRSGCSRRPLRQRRLSLRALLLGTVLAAAQVVSAADLGADAGGVLPNLPATSMLSSGSSGSSGSLESPPGAAPGSAATAVARTLETPPPRQRLAERTPGRLGLHVVMRVALVDVVSHPDSGSLNVALRSRLLGRSIAHAPLALGLAWRF